MHNPITITPRNFTGQALQTVNARELWQYVESSQQFADWIKSRIEKYEFVENVDYMLHKFMKVQTEGEGVIHKFMNNPPNHGGRPTLDYHLTLDMAKELAMVENNAKGREVRRYFINCERQAKAAYEERLKGVPGGMVSPRMQRFAQQRSLPRMDRYQNSAVNRKAAAMGRQMADICRDYLIWELAGSAQDGGEFFHPFVDDYDLQGVLYFATVENVLAYAHAQANARFRAQLTAIRG